MSNILNYEKDETIATGFVRPKVTSLFFDKIWLPKSLLDTSYDFLGIPEEVLIIEKEELIINNYPKKSAGLYYKSSFAPNRRMSDEDFYSFYLLNNLKRPLTQIDLDKVEFKYSKNRNHAILVNSENFNRKYKLHISPIFHDLTEFERDIEDLKGENLYKNNSLKYRLKKPNTFLNKDALSICIQDFPSIKEDELSWEQVLEIRKDKKRIQQLKRFTAWANKISSNKSPDEIREIFDSEIEAYKETLKEYGIKTAIGTFSTIVSSASSLASIIAKPDLFLFPMLSITAVSLNFSVNTYFSNLKNRNNPIAFLYDIEK